MSDMKKKNLNSTRFDIPPELEVQSGIPVGKILLNDQTLYPLHLSPEDLQIPLLITGGEGMGKSTLALHMLNQIAKEYPEVNWCVFDTFSPILLTNTKDVFQMIHSLKFATRLVKVTGIGIVHSGVHDDQTMATIRSLADAVIEVEKVEKGSGSAIKITKYPGKHKKGPFPIEETESGVNIIPIEMPDLM